VVAGSRWLNWFSDEDSSADGAAFAESLQAAHDCLAVAAMPWFQKYLDRLYEESTKTGEIGDHIAMIRSVAEANALKRERAWLTDQIARARVFVQQSKEA
jgi:hypothetical protein